MSINFEDSSNYLPQKLLIVGIGASKIIKKAKNQNDNIINEFLKKVLLAFFVCAKYLASKLPLKNKFLKTVFVLDLCVLTTKSTSALNALENLPTLTSVISSDEEEKYQQETRQIIVDFELPSTGNRADKWWYSLEKKYPKLTKLALPLLSIFHGPRVENYFIVDMGDFVDKKSKRMQVEIYSAIQSVNYGPSSRAAGSMKCVSVFRRENKVSSPVMPRLSFNINNACAAKRQTNVPDVTEKSTESQCFSEKKMLKKVTLE